MRDWAYNCTSCPRFLLLTLCGLFFFLSGEYEYKCHVSPHQAASCSSRWFSGQHITLQKNPIYNFSFLFHQIILVQSHYRKSSSDCTICHCDTQESSEEKTQLMKERLSRLFEANEQRCSRRVLYGSDLLQACTLGSEPGHSALTAGGWSWVGRESCIRAQRTCVATTSALKSSLHSVDDCLEAASSLFKRF